MGKADKRKDNKGFVLKKGESQRKDGTYRYRWTDGDGKAHDAYAQTLSKLREKEKQITKNMLEGIRSDADAEHIILADIFDVFMNSKVGLIADSTCANYVRQFQSISRYGLDKRPVKTIKKSDIVTLYSRLSTDKGLAGGKGLSKGTLSVLNTLVTRLFEMAVDDDIIRKNPAKGALRAVTGSKKQEELPKDHVFTKEQRERFLTYLKTSNDNWYYPILLFMFYTGLRAGEVAGLRWSDIDTKNNMIHIRGQLTYQKNFSESSEPWNGQHRYSLRYATPKTKAGVRIIPLHPMARNAITMMYVMQQAKGIRYNGNIDGISDFVFLAPRSGKPFHPGDLSRALTDAARRCNKNRKPGDVMIPHFSAHKARHTFATVQYELGASPKEIQAMLGHESPDMSMQVYTHMTSEFLLEDVQKRVWGAE